MALSDLSDPNAVIKAMRECDRMKREPFLRKYGFGKSKGYMILDPYTGQAYDSMPIAAVAHKKEFPFMGPLTRFDVRGGKGKTGVEQKLRKLGFKIFRIGKDGDAIEVDPTHELKKSDWKSALVPAPMPPVHDGGRKQAKSRPRNPKTPDYAARDQQNRELGEAGEKWVVELERTRLRSEGCADLAKAINWVAKSRGDGLGYDIESFNANGTTRYIEVKTTNGGQRTAFLISRNEVAVSKEKSRAYCLYRVYDFDKNPKFYFLQGNLEKKLSLEPQQYRAFPK